MEKYYITGFSGFVSKHFLDYLESLNKPIAVFGVDREAPRFDYKSFKNLNCVFQTANLLSTHEWESDFESFKPDYILHLASFSSVALSWTNPIASFTNNTNVFLNLLECVRKHKLKCRILSIGSSEEYGNIPAGQLPLIESTPLRPVSPYAVARVSQELLSEVYVRGFGCDIVMTRSFNHIGPGQSEMFVISSFAKQLITIQKKQLEPILLTGDTSIVRDFVDVRDVVRGYYQLLMQGRSGEVYNICGGTGVTLHSIIGKMSELLKIKISENLDPRLIRPNDNQVIIGSYKKMEEELGWRPLIPLEKSLADILNYWDELTQK